MKQLSSLPKISVSVLLLFFCLTASGGNPYHPSAGAGEAGKAYVCVMKQGFWSSFHNQALLSYNKSFSIGSNYENRFSIAELGTRSAGLIIPAGKASMGVVYSHFGYTDFKRDMTGLACGMKLSEKISAGLQIDYYSERTIGEYNKYQSVTCEAGLLVSPTDKTMIGIHIFNPVPNSLRKTFLPTTLRIGAGTHLNKLLFAGVEAEMGTDSNLNIRTGLEYEVAEKLWLRSGFNTDK